eukprot:RCo049707
MRAVHQKGFSGVRAGPHLGRPYGSPAGYDPARGHHQGGQRPDALEMEEGVPSRALYLSWRKDTGAGKVSSSLPSPPPLPLASPWLSFSSSWERALTNMPCSRLFFFVMKKWGRDFYVRIPVFQCTCVASSFFFSSLDVHVE